MQTNRWFVGVGVLAVVGVCLVLGLRRSPDVLLEPSAEFLPPDQPIIAPTPSLFERWVPMSWSWLWRLREGMHGPRETVSIQAMVIEFAGDANQTWVEELQEPMAETNGMRGWIASGLLVEKLRQEMVPRLGGKCMMWPSVKTSHGILSTMWSGSMIPTNFSRTPVGFTLEVLSQARGGGTKLTTRVNFSELATNSASPSVVSIRTNLCSAAWWQLPPGMGCVLMGPDRGDGLGRVGILYSVHVQRPK